MKVFRKVLFWAHLTCGVVAGLVILLMSVTGVLLTYEKQMTRWADMRNYAITPALNVQRMPVESLIAQVNGAQKTMPTNVTVWAGERTPVAFGLERGRTVYADPYTGVVLGAGATGTRQFFHVMTDWHRWLGTEGAGRATGRAITGACNLAFLFIVVSGIYLWFPRTWTWPQFRNVLWFRRRLPSKARDFNWHNVIGFWSLLPLFFIVLSGVVISYPWAGNLVYRLVGETPPTPAAQRPPNQNSGNAPALSTTGLNQAWARAEQFAPGWNSLSLRLPNTPEAPWSFTIDHGMGGEPHKRATLTLERATGNVVKWEPFTNFTTGRKLRSILRFTHTGEIGGFLGQTLAGLVSLGAVFLVYTGLALSWRRLRAWLAQRAKVTLPAPIADAGAN